MEIIAINDTFKYIDVEGDLIPIDTLESTRHTFKIPTVLPVEWKQYIKVTQEAYDIEFKRKYKKNVYDMLKTTSNVVVAGGAAASPLYVLNKDIYTDVDIFIYGIFDELIFWDKVNEISSKLITIEGHSTGNGSSHTVIQKMKKGIVVIAVLSEDRELIAEYQIILRMYHTVSSIIHAFDVPSCCVCYDGNIAYTTTLGAYAHTNQVNLVSTTYRSTSFEKRLIKYFDRGYGLGLIGYNLEKGYCHSRLILSHKYLVIDVYNRSGNLIQGHISPKMRYGYDNEYATIREIRLPYNEFITQVQCIEDIGLILSESADLIDYSLFHDMEVADIISKFPGSIANMIERQCNQIQRTELRSIKNMKFPKTIINEILDHIMSCSEFESNKKISTILMEQINAHARYIPEWIIVQDPQRQYTAAINPVIEDPEEWYGPGLYIK